jgi:hypothetical protein
VATVSIYLDDDQNPLNGNQKLLAQIPVPGNGASSVSYLTTNILFAATNASPGYHSLFATISGGGRTRYLYAPRLIQIVSSNQPPVLDIAINTGGQSVVGINGQIGQTIILQNSTDLLAWVSMATNTLPTNRWVITNAIPVDNFRGFYRALAP